MQTQIIKLQKGNKPLNVERKSTELYHHHLAKYYKKKEIFVDYS
jgi:hypothetical protein